MNLACVNEPYDLYREFKKYQPDNFQRVPIDRIETAESIDHFVIFRNTLRNIFITFLFNIKLKTKEYVTNKPISISAYCEGDLYFAENDNLAVCGTGNNLEDAIDDLKMHIIHFYEYYRKMDEKKLIGEALRLKNLYANLFNE